VLTTLDGSVVAVLRVSIFSWYEKIKIYLRFNPSPTRAAIGLILGGGTSDDPQLSSLVENRHW